MHDMDKYSKGPWRADNYGKCPRHLPHSGPHARSPLPPCQGALDWGGKAPASCNKELGGGLVAGSRMRGMGQARTPGFPTAAWLFLPQFPHLGQGGRGQSQRLGKLVGNVSAGQVWSGKEAGGGEQEERAQTDKYRGYFGPRAVPREGSGGCEGSAAVSAPSRAWGGQEQAGGGGFGLGGVKSPSDPGTGRAETPHAAFSPSQPPAPEETVVETCARVHTRVFAQGC